MRSNMKLLSAKKFINFDQGLFDENVQRVIFSHY